MLKGIKPYSLLEKTTGVTILTLFSFSSLCNLAVDSLPELFLAYCTIQGIRERDMWNDSIPNTRLVPNPYDSDPMPLITDWCLGLWALPHLGFWPLPPISLTHQLCTSAFGHYPDPYLLTMYDTPFPLVPKTMIHWVVPTVYKDYHTKGWALSSTLSCNLPFAPIHSKGIPQLVNHHSTVILTALSPLNVTDTCPSTDEVFEPRNQLTVWVEP